jgi:CRP/FNR family transcriptional regulator, cyclic AMP receptor protein
MTDSAKYANLARRIPLFKGIAPEDVHKIFAKGMTLVMEKDNVIFYEGTTGNQMFVVLAGTVDLFSGKKKIARLTSGDMFGEMALINNEPRSATAVAVERSQMFVLSETVFQKLLTKRVAIRILINIVGVMSDRLRNANKRLVAAGDEPKPQS